MGEEGGLYFPYGGAPLPNEPASQYRCVNLPNIDDNDRTYHLDYHIVYASFWASASYDQFKSIILEKATPEEKIQRRLCASSSIVL